MGWVTVGTLTPQLDNWSFIGSPLIYGQGLDVSLFRFTHNWEANLWPSGKAWFAAYFQAQDTYALFEPIYPFKNGSRLIHSPVPLGYQQAGLTSRTIAIKADSRARIYDGSNWTINIEYFQPDSATISPELAAITEVDQSVDQLAEDVQELTDSLFPEP